MNIFSVIARRQRRRGNLQVDCFASLAMTIILLLSACSIGDHPQVITYTINAVTATPQQCRAKANLQIIEPTVAPGLDSSRIAVMQGPARIDYYAGVKWAAPVSEMLQSVLVDSFEKSSSFANVSTEAQTIHNDLVLITEIRNFEVTDQASGKIHIRIVSKLVNAKDRKVLATIPVEKVISPAIFTMTAIIAAFNNASATAAAEIATASANALPHCKPGK